MQRMLSSHAASFIVPKHYLSTILMNFLNLTFGFGATRGDVQESFSVRRTMW